MKHVIITFLSLVMSYGAAFAETAKEHAPQRTFGYSNSLIFVENGITFSVYPDGEFDFFIDNPNYLGAAYSRNGVNISFNAGFNYDPWVQYDDYGAILQVENTPVYYDFYGRVNRIGDINIYYNRGRVSRIGGLYVYYDPYGGFSRFRGYINVFNRHFYYRPVYNYFSRPAVRFCLVSPRPYRRYYQPVRYTYYRPYRNNNRRVHATVGRTYHYKDSNPRRAVYRNDKRVVSRNDVRVRKNIRNRSLGYEKNKRNYDKRTPYRQGDRKTVVNNNRGYNKGYNSGRNSNVKRPGRNGDAKRTGKGYSGKKKYPERISTSRSTTVKRPGKTVTRKTTVTRSSNSRANKVQQPRTQKNRSYGSSSKNRSYGSSSGKKPAYKSNQARSSRSNNKSSRSSRGSSGRRNQA